MSISKVAQFVTPPETVGDYDAQNAHIAGFTRQLAGPSMALTEWENSTTIPALALGTYLSHGGYLYRVDTEDYVIASAPSADGTYYLRLEASGDTLVATWISSLASYVWNALYNGLYNGSYQVLPYQLVKAGAVLSKRKIMNLWQGSGFQTVDREGVLISGGDKLYRISNESIGLNLSGTINISAMIVGEVKFFNGHFNDTGGFLNAPTIGTFTIVLTISGTMTYTVYNGPIPANSRLITCQAGQLGGFHGVLTRIS